MTTTKTNTKTMNADRGQKHDELAGLQNELADLEAAIVRQDPPLDPHTMAIARVKIAKLRELIKELEC
jgi:hypothetical protein